VNIFPFTVGESSEYPVTASGTPRNHTVLILSVFCGAFVLVICVLSVVAVVLCKKKLTALRKDVHRFGFHENNNNTHEGKNELSYVQNLLACLSHTFVVCT